MKCPTCGENTPDAWLTMQPTTTGGSVIGNPAIPTVVTDEGMVHASVCLDYMFCAAAGCGQLVVRLHDSRLDFGSGGIEELTNTTTVYPRRSARPVDPLVPASMARDYHEAVAILDVSHRMSAVLARRILADLLEKYAGLTEYGLAARIDAFIADTSHPYTVRDSLHYLREVADFSAHTQTNDNAEVIDASEAEAAWTLEVVERLFDYFIVGPEKDRILKEGIDAKLKEAGRNEIKPLPPDPEVP